MGITLLLKMVIDGSIEDVPSVTRLEWKRQEHQRTVLFGKDVTTTAYERIMVTATPGTSKGATSKMNMTHMDETHPEFREYAEHKIHNSSRYRALLDKAAKQRPRQVRTSSTCG